MPKRIPTPPPPEDEPRYLTVVHPYPLNANLMIHADRRTLALWLACCTGKDVLLAMYYKPAAHGMVIIEVDRDFDQFERLLGLHSWSKFLSRPSGEEQDKESKVFWCHYNSGRLVQKHGWKRVDIEEHWFKGWSPNNTKITFPYPKTTWCEEPSEAKTGVPLCRPLPQAHFPAPPKATASPPVGSPAWISAKSSDTSSVAKSSSRRKGDRSIAPSDSVSMISSASSGSGTNRGAQSPRASAASTVSTAWRMAEYRARQGASSGPPSVASLASPPGSRAPSTIDSRHGSRSRSSNGPAGLPAKPPGLDLQYERFDWGEEVDAFEAERDDEPTRSASSVSGNFGPRGLNAPDRYVPDPEGPVDPNQDYEYDDDNRPKRSIAAAMKEAFDGDSDDELTHDWGRDPGEVVDDRNPWNGYDAPRWEPPTKINRKGGEEWKCPDHGPLCNPGICKERARVERERREQKWREERQEAKRKREEKWEREKMKKENKAARDEGRELPHDLPPHVARGSDSDSDGDSGSTGGETEGNQGSDAGTESGVRSRPPANPDEEDMWEPRPLWSDDDDDDDDDDESPKVNIVVRRAPSIADTYYDERERGPPSLSNVSRSTASSRQPPGNTRSSVSVSSAASSAWGNKPAGAQSPAPGQRKSAWDTRNAASSRHTAPSTRGSQDDASTQPRPPPGLRQPAGKPRGPSVSTVASSTDSERPIGSYAPCVTLHNTASSAAGGRPPSSVARTSSSTSARTAVSSESAPPEGGFPTFGHTEWGDTIAAAQRRKKSDRSHEKKGSDVGGSDEADEMEEKSQSEHNSSGTGKKYRGWTKGRAAKRGGAPPPQFDTLTVALDIDLPPGGPGSTWGNGNEAW